ncbi:MAG: beta-lactamase [Methyloceanibacter sp.]|nr:MAG: beta-lactamase [Methyloceanibacter sp.]
MISRRSFILRSGAALSACVLLPSARALAKTSVADLEKKFAAIEAKSGGRLGVSVHDTGTGLKAAHRGDERFPLCSTFKVLAAAAVLNRVDKGEETLSREVPVPKDSILEYAPVAEKHAGGVMSLSDLCAAAMIWSDNTAANLIFESLARDGLSGPEAATAFVRSLGDTTTRMDRMEPELNEFTPGDPRDTTTPDAMAGLLQQLFLGEALSPLSRDRLTEWFVACETGRNRLRAGMPETWRVGDKTGSADGITNDVAVAWPATGDAILIAAYISESKADGETRDAALADVGKAVATLAE